MCVQLTPPNERLRELPGVKLLVDLVQINAAAIAAQLRRVVWFVCGNTLVCESIRDARSMAFDQPEHHKVRHRHRPSARETVAPRHRDSAFSHVNHLWLHFQV